jgi:hypothetical protein
MKYEVKSNWSRAIRELYKFANSNGYQVNAYNTKLFQSIVLLKNGKVAVILYKDKITNKTFLNVY